MGGLCAKGSKTADPDKTPYGKGKASKKGSKENKNVQAVPATVPPAQPVKEEQQPQQSQQPQQHEQQLQQPQQQIEQLEQQVQRQPQQQPEKHIQHEQQQIEIQQIQPEQQPKKEIDVQALTPRKRPPKKEYKYTPKTTIEVVQDKIKEIKAEQSKLDAVNASETNAEIEASGDKLGSVNNEWNDDKGKEEINENPALQKHTVELGTHLENSHLNKPLIINEVVQIERHTDPPAVEKPNLRGSLASVERNTETNGRETEKITKVEQKLTESTLIQEVKYSSENFSGIVDQPPKKNETVSETNFAKYVNEGEASANGLSGTNFNGNHNKEDKVLNVESENKSNEQKFSEIISKVAAGDSNTNKIDSWSRNAAEKGVLTKSEKINKSSFGFESSNASTSEEEHENILIYNSNGSENHSKFNGNGSQNKVSFEPHHVSNGKPIVDQKTDEKLNKSNEEKFADSSFKSSAAQSNNINDEKEEKKSYTSKLPTIISATSPKILSPTSSLQRSSRSPSNLISSPAEDAELFNQKNLRSLTQKDSVIAKNILTDFSQENKMIIDLHQIHANTRTKLLNAVDQWFKKDEKNAPRVMAISGESGVGKTCIAAEICRKYSNDLLAFHFFQFNPFNQKHNHASEMLKSFAQSFGKAFPEYLQVLSKAVNPSLSELNEGLSLTEIFDLIIKSLHAQNSHRASHKRMLIVIDDIGECTVDERSELSKVIESLAQKAPDWLYLFLTVDTGSEMLGQIGEGLHMIEVKGTSEAMSADLKRYFKDPMSTRIDRISLDGAQAQLMQLSQGSFLAARLLSRRIECLPVGAKLSLKDVALFPAGLTNICTQSFQKLHSFISSQLSPAEAAKIYTGYVAILLLAKEPIDSSAFSHLHPGLEAGEALAQLEGCVTVSVYNLVTLSHKCINKWILSVNSSSNVLVPDLKELQQNMAENVMTWLQPVLSGTAKYPVERNLEIYALKHCIGHLMDATNQHDNILQILCNLQYLDKKLKLSRQDCREILREYNYNHHKLLPNGNTKLINLETYLKKESVLKSSFKEYRELLERSGRQILPTQIFNQAANFLDSSELQNEASNHLKALPWLQDFSNFASTPFQQSSFEQSILDFDLSHDGKHLTVLTGGLNEGSEECSLHILNTSNFNSPIHVVDLQNIRDRSGNTVRILSDGGNVFVGSLGSYIGLKTGKPVMTGFDLVNIPIKEKYSIDSCDINGNLLCCSVTTLPYGGRTLLMLVFDIKTKKFVKSLEILKFKFGGNPQFGTRSSALSSDGSLLCAIVKQTSKCEMKGMLWSTSNWNLQQIVQLGSELLSKCIFINNQTIMASAGVKLQNPDFKPSKSYIWSVPDESTKEIDEIENASLLSCRGTQVTNVQWFQFSRHARVSRWKKWLRVKAPDNQAMVYGLDGILDVTEVGEQLLFIAKNVIRIYKTSDLEKINASNQQATGFRITDALVKDVTCVPRSDDLIVTYTDISKDKKSANSLSVATVKIKSNEFQVVNNLLSDEPMLAMEQTSTTRCFTAQFSCLGVCRILCDNTRVALCTGTTVLLTSLSNDEKKSFKHPASIQSSNNLTILHCAVSPKDFSIAVVYAAAKSIVFIHDAQKPDNKPLELLLPNADEDCSVIDLSFISSNGSLLSYYSSSAQNSLSVWNPRSGALISHEPLEEALCYVAVSPASDRFTLSYSADGSGVLTLRNSDDSFTTEVTFADETSWLPDRQDSDVEFTADGTVMLGICGASGIFRVWNAGNGEALKDLNLDVASCSRIEISGVLTNTHVLLNCDNTLLVFDIGVGELVAALYVDEHLTRKTSSSGLKISSKGNYIAGCSELGALKVFQAHNIFAVKLKTTLQRMKSL